MGQAQYEIYRNNVLSLAKSMVIKCSAVADAINDALAERNFAVDSAQPATWKYYLNLAGQYHPTDTPMTVISQDTLQTIDFTPENLALNTATAQAYAVGGRYYQDLVKRYPSQRLLIRGILHPIPIQTAIDANDGTILWHDSSLVESNEMSLILDLQGWCQRHFRRWHVPAYANVDDLYLPSMLGILYHLLPSMILQLRLKACHTYQAHSYHISEYLGAHGGLDQFASSLTKKQMLWLYRNIRYIQRNPGANSTFESLIEHILTERNLPLSDWTMRHDLTDTQTTLKPVPVFERGALNLSLSEGGIDERTVNAMLEAELPLAKDNADDQQTVNEVTSTLSHSLNNRLLTKVLESSVLDTTDATPYKLADALLNHWMYFASIGKYKAIVSIENPKTGDYYTLSASDAFVVYMYAFMKGRGLDIKAIPPLIANKVRKLVTPTPSEIRPYLTAAVSDEMLLAVFLHQPTIANSYISIEAFYNAVSAIHKGELYQHDLFSTQGEMWARAEMEFATLYLWEDVPCDFGTGTLYSSWFSTRNLDVPSLSQAQLYTLADTILATATGINLSNVESLRDIQAAMLKIMARLSSYSVQYLASINDSPIIVMERPSIRVGKTHESAESDDKVTIPHAQLMDELGDGRHTFEDVSIGDVSIFGHRVSGNDVTKIDVMSDGIVSGPAVVKDYVPMPEVGLMSVTDNVSVTVPDHLATDFSQYQIPTFKALPAAFAPFTLDFYQLDEADKAALEDRYNAYVNVNGLPVAETQSFVPYTSLGGMIAIPADQLSDSVPGNTLPPLYPSS